MRSRRWKRHMFQSISRKINSLSDHSSVIAREYYHACLPCMILNGSGTKAQNIIHFRQNGMYEKTIPHIVIHPRQLQSLSDIIDQRMHDDFLAHRPFTLGTRTDSSAFNGNTYILDWAYRLEYCGYAAILPERSTNFYTKSPTRDNVFPGVIHDLAKRKGGLGQLTAAIADAVDKQRAQILRRLPQANSVFSPSGIVKIDAEDLISKSKNL